jgi:hypothetical protein
VLLKDLLDEKNSGYLLTATRKIRSTCLHLLRHRPIQLRGLPIRQGTLGCNSIYGPGFYTLNTAARAASQFESNYICSFTRTLSTSSITESALRPGRAATVQGVPRRRQARGLPKAIKAVISFQWQVVRKSLHAEPRGGKIFYCTKYFTLPSTPLTLPIR